MAWLHALPDYLVFPIIVVPLVVAVAGAPFLRRALFPRRAKYPANSELMDAFIALASSSAIVLTLSLVNAESALRHIEERVAHEASLVNDLDRTFTRYGDARLTALRPKVAQYAMVIASDEWQSLHRGERNRDADHLYSAISKALREIDPDTHRHQLMYAEALRQIDELSDLRDERIEAANFTLPLIYWFTTLTMISLMIVISAMNRPTVERAVITATIAAAIGLLTSLVIIFDAPFQGSGAIPAKPFFDVIEEMRERS